MITSSKGSTALFYDGFKYIKSGESRSSTQYRCINYMRKCRSRIVFNHDKETAMCNNMGHNHPKAISIYRNFSSAAVLIRRFGRQTMFIRPKDTKSDGHEEEESGDEH